MLCPYCGGMIDADHTCTGNGDMRQEIDRLRALVAELTTRLEETRKERDEAREVLGEVVHQACKVEGAERLDSSALRTYADALRLLASWGQVRITSEKGRRVIAEWVEQ